jgi:hypothetical protein
MIACLILRKLNTNPGKLTIILKTDGELQKLQTKTILQHPISFYKNNKYIL